MTQTAIEWTDVVWNPTTGCDRVSSGCDNCYALTMAARLKKMGSAKYQRDGDPRTSGPGFGLTVHPDTLDLPLRWRKPRRVFVNSMSDLFHDNVPDDFIAQVFAVMALAPQHTFQVLTKRPGRMASLLTSENFVYAVDQYAIEPPLGRGTGNDPRVYPGNWPLPNVWLGTSVESQKWADVRVPQLLRTPAAVRWLSCEPLLGPVDLEPWFTARPIRHPIQWIVVGGESGPGARPMHPDWLRSIRNLCAWADPAFFFKQWGAWEPLAPVYLDDPDDEGDFHDERVLSALDDTVVAVQPDGATPQGWTRRDEFCDHQPAPGSWWMRRVGKKAAGRLLDGRTWDEYPDGAV